MCSPFFSLLNLICTYYFVFFYARFRSLNIFGFLQDLECLRRIAGCRDVVLQEDFERMWSWLFPVAFTLSQSAVNPMWDSTSPLWIEGFITKEEAESTLQGLQDPGTFLLRFPTSRSWPHPDAGNLVVTYVDSDYTIRHRLLSFDFIHRLVSCSLLLRFTSSERSDWRHIWLNIRTSLYDFLVACSSPSKETTVTPLQELLLQEPKLSRLGRYFIDLLFFHTIMTFLVIESTLEKSHGWYVDVLQSDQKRVEGAKSVECRRKQSGCFRCEEDDCWRHKQHEWYVCV